jgi:hypothetical protein
MIQPSPTAYTQQVAPARPRIDRQITDAVFSRTRTQSVRPIDRKEKKPNQATRCCTARPKQRNRKTQIDLEGLTGHGDSGDAGPSGAPDQATTRQLATGPRPQPCSLFIRQSSRPTILQPQLLLPII